MSHDILETRNLINTFARNKGCILIVNVSSSPTYVPKRPIKPFLEKKRKKEKRPVKPSPMKKGWNKKRYISSSSSY